jgi:hypothetical protein
LIIGANASDPDGEVAFPLSLKEAEATFYETADREVAIDPLRDIIDHGSKRRCPTARPRA